MENKKTYQPYKYDSGFKGQGSRTKKSEDKPAYKTKRGPLSKLMTEEEKSFIVHC